MAIIDRWPNDPARRELFGLARGSNTTARHALAQLQLDLQAEMHELQAERLTVDRAERRAQLSADVQHVIKSRQQLDETERRLARIAGDEPELVVP